MSARDTLIDNNFALREVLSWLKDLKASDNIVYNAVNSSEPTTAKKYIEDQINRNNKAIIEAGYHTNDRVLEIVDMCQKVYDKVDSRLELDKVARLS